MDMGPDDGVADEALLYRPPPQWLIVTVQQIEPTQPVEHRPVYLHVTFDNETTTTRSGTLVADVTQADGSILHSNVWQVSGVAPSTSTSAILEFDAPAGAASVPYAVHYYDASAPTVPAESYSTASTFPVAIRAGYAFDSMELIAAADAIIGDNLTAYVDESVDGVHVFSNARALGFLHNGTFDFVDLVAPPEYVVPGTAHHATYTARLNRTPNWVASASNSGPYPGVTEALVTFDLNADSIRAFVPDQTLSAPFFETQLSVTSHFCGGVATVLPCPAGQTDYFLFSLVERLGPRSDTAMIPLHVAQIHSTDLLPLQSSTTDGRPVNYVVTSGGGQIFPLMYIPPSVTTPTLARIDAADTLGRRSIIYVEVRP